MAVVTYSEEGQLVTITNRSAQSLAVAGKVLAPRANSSFRLADIQGNRSYMAALEDYIDNGLASVVVQGGEISAELAGQLDASLDPRYYAARDIFTAPIVGDVNGVKTSFLAPAANTTYSGTDLNGAVGVGKFDFPRNFTITGTTGLGEDLDGGDFVVTGLDLDDNIMVETITVAVQGASLVVTTQGNYAFKSITSVYVPLDPGGAARGDYELGFGNKLGFTRPLAQGGLIGEWQDNVTPPGGVGTVAVSSVGLPNGTYTPSQAPNGTRVWICVFCPGS